MTLKNIDLDLVVQKIEQAPTEEKAKVIVEAISEIAEQHYAETVKEYQRDAQELEASKQNITKFGLRNLTSEEKQFINNVAKQAFTGSNINLIPETTVDFIFEDLKKTHPLFDYVTFAPAGMKKWMLSDRSGKSVWGAITATIAEEIEASISSISLDVHKLSSFLYVPKGIVNLGEAWIDKFVRACLEEASSEGLEAGIVAGDGKDAPIGLLKDLEGSVVLGVYPNKTPIAITDFGPDSFGSTVLPTLNRNGGRVVDQIVIVANQNEIDTKIYKATHVKGFGGYQKAELYKNFVFVASSEVPANKAIAYLPKRYVAGISSMGVDASKEYKFLEDMITYAVVTYGNGQLIANDDAIVLDITNLEALVPTVQNIDITPVA
jgi:hypothetical protein